MMAAAAVGFAHDGWIFFVDVCVYHGHPVLFWHSFGVDCVDGLGFGKATDIYCHLGLNRYEITEWIYILEKNEFF